MGVGVAADIAKQGLVIDVAPHMLVEASYLGKPHRQHAGSQGEIARVTRRKVRRIGERHQKVCAPDRQCRHGRLLPRGQVRRSGAAPGGHAEMMGHGTSIVTHCHSMWQKKPLHTKVGLHSSR